MQPLLNEIIVCQTAKWRYVGVCRAKNKFKLVVLNNQDPRMTAYSPLLSLVTSKKDTLRQRCAEGVQNSD